MKLFRIIESVIKKIYNIPKNTTNKELKRTFFSAEYNTSGKKKFLFSNHHETQYVLKNREEISKRIFIGGEFDYRVLEKGLKNLKKKKRKFLISVGSHVGTTLIPAIKNNLFEHCIAFEPSLDNFRLLKANVNINQIEKKVTLLNMALSNKIAEGYLKLCTPNNSGDFRVVSKSKKVERIKLNVLDNFTSKISRNNSLIFMDAQGHEPEIFLGGKKTLKKKIPMIFELMPSIIKKQNPEGLYNSIKHYKNLTDLRENRILKMNKTNFLKIYYLYEKNKSYTDIMVF
jgi:FkbM family methyltransferase